MKEKHFLDTTVLRALLTSEKKVKDYYTSCLTGQKYICKYIRMEYFRGFIANCIQFYFLLTMPSVGTLAEAISIWSNKFGSRKPKNILTMISNLLNQGGIKNSKQRMEKRLADYIRRLISKTYSNFSSIGNDATHCIKGRIKMAFNPKDIDTSFHGFLDAVSDKEAHLKCKVEKFLKQTHVSELSKLVEKKDIKLEAKKDGFNKLVERIPTIQETKITCAYCSKLGDLIIALIYSKEWQLEHTDYSFDYICEILKKRHFRHSNDTKLLLESE